MSLRVVIFYVVNMCIVFRMEVNNMKQRTVILFALMATMILSSHLLTAQNVESLLDKVKSLYVKGQVKEARKVLLQVKAQFDSNLLDEQEDDYQELNNWNIVKINPQGWTGKRVKIKDRFIHIDSDSVQLLSVGHQNQFSDIELAEKIAGLKVMEWYSWYGEIILTGYRNDTPALLIEYVE